MSNTKTFKKLSDTSWETPRISQMENYLRPSSSSLIRTKSCDPPSKTVIPNLTFEKASPRTSKFRMPSNFSDSNSDLVFLESSRKSSISDNTSGKNKREQSRGSNKISPIGTPVHGAKSDFNSAKSSTSIFDIDGSKGLVEGFVSLWF